ncbi:extracellular solute-binding protein [Gracilibacillus oryzae]|uniref:extracellular solute-binding protein n=1 Tax=Gracilibacillus oryzae TaxID=1672701 RepID=UPI001D1854D3|nr:extracellular solute-binding protein [Gracilibacillus oryzae]
MKKWLLVFVIAALCFMAACSNEGNAKEDEKEESNTTANINETGMPIVNEPITLQFMARKSLAEDNGDVLIWKEYSKMTGINVEWEIVPRSGIDEKRNLALASGDIPDVFYQAHMPNTDLLKYGKQGVFLPLNDLIDEHMPNLSNLLNEYPEIKKGITFPDGNIYSLPMIYDPEFTSVIVGHKLWVRQDWLEKLNMEQPQTTEEFYQYLKAVKETDLNGNGKQDEVPYGATQVSGLMAWLKGAYGVGNRGGNHPFIDMDPDTNELRFYPTTDEYLEMLKYMHRLFDEGLIQENIFTIEGNQVQATGAEGLYGSTVTTSPETLWGEAGKNYVGMTPLEGPAGLRSYHNMRSPLGQMGNFVITNKNQHPEATVRWMDHFYGDEGTKMFFMGIEGETYTENEDGSVEYVDKIKNPEEGITFEQALGDYVTWLGGGYPGVVKEKYFQGAETLPSSLEATKKIEPYMIDEVWPLFTYTREENQKIASFGADIEKYVNEMRDKFITGAASFSEWEEYVQNIEQMNLKEYMEIQQAAYERYSAN